ncbi:hypothetical protein IAR50_000560 [Cryptococcus sp. DSM 104548]
MAFPSTKPRKSLGDIIDAIPTQRDYVPDSCSEGSGSEDEGSILPVQSLKPIPLTPVSSNRGPRISGGLPKTGLPLKDRDMSGGAGRAQDIQQASIDNFESAMFFSVMWRKPQYKKVGGDRTVRSQTWDGDATIKILGDRICMIDEDGNQMAATAVGSKVIKPEVEFKVGGYEIQVDHRIQAEEFKSSTSILNRPRSANAASYSPAAFAKPFRPPTQKSVTTPMRPFKPPTSSVAVHTPIAGPSTTSALPTPAAAQKAVAAASFYGKPTPKAKVERIVIGEKSNKERLEWGGALYNPKAPGAVVMPRPTEKAAKLKDTSIVDVVVDPALSNIMREHQKQGVKFMYECVMGMTQAEGEGCILADEMGLGKTLQTIALIYTMLKQSPFANQSGIIGKAMIVCPVSLVDNWRKEFKKWVDRRVNVLVADGTDHRISSFVNNKHQHVLIIGYERLRKEIKDLSSCVPPIGLIVCDEGHRLKSKDNKTTKMFDMLKTQRRIILSGTPVQNDLGEYWAMVNFACPGVLGKYTAFAKHYEKPILKSRTMNCSDKDVATGKARAEELAKLSKEFVLRRTAAVLENYLPPKYEYVVFIAPSKLQLSVFSRLLDPKIVGNFIRGHGAQSLALIDIMRKISNSPMLLRKTEEDSSRADSDLSTAKSAALSAIPSSTHVNDVNASGKMLVLDKMLHNIHKTTDEKIVVVSNWTSTLDLIQGLCKAKRYPVLRLDGSTPAKQRQELVDRFNKDKDRKDSFVFLLSAKAGGVGLNLIGASRLVLFDSDWNPSTDLQAMARIHRDGQKRPVYIYRFLTTNAIDEKIYQRQITKTGLSEQMLDHNSSETTTTNKDSFSAAELRDIFTLNLRTNGCQTHDLLGCDCTLAASGEVPQIAAEPASVDSDDAEHDCSQLLGSESDEDEDEGPKFVSANNYDPEPTPKMRRKAAKEQSNKLAALKHWTHYDAYESKSFRGIQDTLLYNMIFDSWDEDDAVARDSAAEDDEDEDAEEVDELDSDEDRGATKKRKSMGAGKKGSAAKKAKTIEVDAAVTSRKKHNLRSISERETGRVTFVFEKVSKSKL